MGCSTGREHVLSDNRKYRKFTSKQKVGELVLASFRGDRSIAELCREYSLAESLLRKWRSRRWRRRSVSSRCRTGRLRPSSGGGSRSWSGLLVARSTSSRSHCEAGSERARRPVSRAGGARLQAGGGRTGDADLPAGDLPHACPTAGEGAPAGPARPGRPGDRRGRARQPDRRLPDGRGARHAQAWRGGQPQAGAARDPRAAADPAAASA
jgi:hypothetical protein